MLNLTQYAAHRKAAGLRGGSLMAVQKAIAAGRIHTVNGKIDPVAADEAWLRNTNPIKQANSAKHATRVASKPTVPSQEPPAVDQAPLPDVTEAPYVPPAAGSLAALQIELAAFKLKQAKREFLKEGKRLVDGRKVKAEMIERAANERQAILNIPKRWAPILATELGIEERKIYLALTARVREFLTERSGVPAGVPSSVETPRASESKESEPSVTLGVVAATAMMYGHRASASSMGLNA